MLRASDIGDHSPHAVGNANDPAIRRIRWLNDSFPDLLFPDRVWGEAIKASRLWEEWGPTGLVRDPVFTRLLNNGVWDSREGGRSMAEIESMRYTAAMGSRLMLRALELEDKVSSLQVIRVTSFNHETTARQGREGMEGVPKVVERLHRESRC